MSCIHRGDEKGKFEFGGSTIVLLFKKDAVEIDDDLIPVLADTLAEYPHVEIRHQDFLTVNLKEELAPFMNDGYEISIAANLPYYITSDILE